MAARSATLAVGIIGQDQAARLPPLLRHASRFADEILYVDGGSTDDSRRVVEAFPKARFISRRFDGNFARQRNVVMENLRSDWVLFLDTDELAGPLLLRLLPRLLASGFGSISMPRYWLASENPALYVDSPRHYPDRQTRLIRNRPGARYDESRPVHEWIPRQHRDPVLRLKHAHLLHYCLLWEDRAARERKVARYESVRHDPLNRELYLFEDFRHRLRPCREAWLDGGTRTSSVDAALDLLRFGAFALRHGAFSSGAAKTAEHAAGEPGGGG